MGEADGFARTGRRPTGLTDAAADQVGPGAVEAGLAVVVARARLALSGGARRVRPAVGVPAGLHDGGAAADEPADAVGRTAAVAVGLAGGGADPDPGHVVRGPLRIVVLHRMDAALRLIAVGVVLAELPAAGGSDAGVAD